MKNARLLSTVAATTLLLAVCTENLNPNIVVMKPAEDRV
jgi:hypothetical protein